MDVNLKLVAYEDKAVLSRLLELYNHDLSEFYDDLQVNEHGLFQYRHLDHYWTEDGRFPYFLRVDGRLAGFVLVRDVEGLLQIAEFFVLRPYRRHGVGAVAAKATFKNHPGPWEVRHASSNTGAAAFWLSVIPLSAIRAEHGRETVYRFRIEAIPNHE